MAETLPSLEHGRSTQFFELGVQPKGIPVAAVRFPSRHQPECVLGLLGNGFIVMTADVGVYSEKLLRIAHGNLVGEGRAS